MTLPAFARPRPDAAAPGTSPPPPQPQPRGCRPVAAVGKPFQMPLIQSSQSPRGLSLWREAGRTFPGGSPPVVLASARSSLPAALRASRLCLGGAWTHGNSKCKYCNLCRCGREGRLTSPLPLDQVLKAAMGEDEGGCRERPRHRGQQPRPRWRTRCAAPREQGELGESLAGDVSSDTSFSVLSSHDPQGPWPRPCVGTVRSQSGPGPACQAPPARVLPATAAGAREPLR